MSKNVVATNFIWRFMERISAQLVTFFVSIFIARILSPADYSAISIILVFITFANILVSNGFATALIQSKKTDSLDFSSVFYFSFAFSIILYFILFFIAPYIAKWYNMPILSPTLRVLGIRIIISSINSLQHSYVARNMAFRKFFFSTLGGTIISAIVGVICAVNKMGVWALVLQYLTNTLIDTVVLWITVKWRPTREFSLHRLARLLSYGWKLLTSALIGAIYDDLRTLIIGKANTKEDLAFYSKGQQFPKLIMTNVSTSITSVVFPYFSKLQDDKERLKKSIRKTLRTSTVIIAPLMIGLLTIATPLVKLLLTNKWIDCVPFLQISCLFYLISSIYTIYLQGYKSIGKSGLALIIELVDDVFGIILVILFLKKGAFYIASVMVISRVIACVVCFYYNKKLFDMKMTEQFYDIVIPIVFSLIMSVSISLFNLININYILRMIVQCVCGFIVYSFMCLIFRYPFLKSIFALFDDRKKVKISEEEI